MPRLLVQQRASSPLAYPLTASSAVSLVARRRRPSPLIHRLPPRVPTASPASLASMRARTSPHLSPSPSARTSVRAASSPTPTAPSQIPLLRPSSMAPNALLHAPNPLTSTYFFHPTEKERIHLRCATSPAGPPAALSRSGRRTLLRPRSLARTPRPPRCDPHPPSHLRRWSDCCRRPSSSPPLQGGVVW